MDLFCNEASFAAFSAFTNYNSENLSLKCQFINTTLIWKAKAIFITYIHTIHFELSDYKGQQWVSQNSESVPLLT